MLVVRARGRAAASPIARFALVAALIAPVVSAQTPAQSNRQVHTRSAPPAGEPQEDEDPVVDVSVVYTFDLWRNARGGLRKGERYLDNLDVTLTVDAERALGWSGATLFLYGLYNNGESLTDNLVGDLQVVSNIEGGVNALRLYEAWVEQRFADERASVKAGLYDLNSEFDAMEASSLFMNGSHGTGLDLGQSGRNGPSIFPFTSVALRADYRAADNWLVRAAVLDGVPGDPERPKRTTVKLGGGDGALIIGELEYADSRTKAAVGYWRYTSRFHDLLASRLGGQTVERSGNDGLYLSVEQKLIGKKKPGAGLSGWLRLGFADENLNWIERYMGGGLVYKRPFASRPEDQLGIAVAWAELGAPYRRALALADESSDKHEVNVELTYRAALAPWFTIQPDMQYVINPSGNPVIKDALVLGLRIEVGF